MFVWHVAQAHDYIHNYTAAHVMPDEEEDLTQPFGLELAGPDDCSKLSDQHGTPSHLQEV